MDEKKVNVIKGNLDSESTEALSDIWKNNNLVEYSPAGFEAVRRILVERNVPLPDQIPFTASRREQAEKGISETRIPLGFGGKSIVLLLGIGIFLLWMCVGDAIKDAIVGEPNGPDIYSRMVQSIRLGKMRVALDAVALGISVALCLVAGIWHLISKAKVEPKVEYSTSEGNS